MLNNIVDNLEQCGSKTLFNAVFIRPEQVVRFLLCRQTARRCYSRPHPSMGQRVRSEKRRAK